MLNPDVDSYTETIITGKYSENWKKRPTENKKNTKTEI